MPSTSKKQAGFMAGCANNPGSMRGKCPPHSVAMEFNAADRAKARRRRRVRDVKMMRG